MYFKIIKGEDNRLYERKVLDENPLVEFVDYPLFKTFITDGHTVRDRTVDVKTHQIDNILEYINHPNMKLVKFFILANDENSVFSSITYNPDNFEPIRCVRMAAIAITLEERECMLNDIKTPEEITNDNNYQYLLIRR